MIKRRITCILLIVVFSLCAGCSQKKALEVGYIDVDQLLAKCDKYMEFAQQYRNDQAEFFKKFSKDPSQMSPKEREAYEKENQAMKEKWDKIKTGIRDEIKEAAKEIARAQRLDLILDNSSSTPTIEYGGKNITGDIKKYVEELDKEKK